MNYTKHKIRLDRGRMWYSLFQAIITALLVNIFSSDSSLKFKILSAVSAFVVIYLLGWVDDLLKLVDREQKGYSERNPVMMDIMNELKEIKSKL